FIAKLNANMEYVWVETEKNQAPDFSPSAIDTTVAWNETIQKAFISGSFNGTGTLTWGNPGQLEDIMGGQGYLVVMEPDGKFTERVNLTIISRYGVSGSQILPFG